MTQNAKTLVVFVGVLLTVGFWMPLSNAPRLGPAGGTITDTYFGVLRYATMHAVMKEPEFSLSWTLDMKRLVLTLVVTGIFWGSIFWLLRRAKHS